jgi:predicted negative regulator of RcsB-dependent stress response
LSFIVLLGFQGLIIPFISHGDSSYNLTNFMFRVDELVNKFGVFLSALSFALLFSGDVIALGLGELRSMPNLGDRLRLEIEIIGTPKEIIDPACFRLSQAPNQDDLPRLKQATFSIRKGNPAILEIRSDAPLRDPILQLSIHIACGHEMVRNYIILASPEPISALTSDAPLSPGAARVPVSDLRLGDSPPPRKRSASRVRARSTAPEQLQKVVPDRVVPRATLEGISDRLMLSGVDVGDPSLLLSTEMLSPSADRASVNEAQREILRLEFRTLLALHEQATTQLAAAEKLRSLEASLTELKRQADILTQSAVPPTVAKPLPPTKPVVVEPEESFVSEWGLYLLLIALLLAVGGFLGWRNYRERQLRALDDDIALSSPDFPVDPKRSEEREELGGVDLDVDPAIMGAPMKLDFPLDEDIDAEKAPKATAVAQKNDSLMSISATTVDEHFEANPVLELADIMLSFGRVKGAAQALQEYIDQNPQEALQPWIRLMEVYRLAGLREEFEKVAHNLNQNFNVEIQQWDPVESKSNWHNIDMLLDDSIEQVTQVQPEQTKVESMEDLVWIVDRVTELWADGDVIGYLQRLLRDNREGKRAGFALQVVADMLFLVELKEIVLKSDVAATASR